MSKFWEFLKKYKLAGAGLFFVICVFAIAIFAPLISPFDPNDISIVKKLCLPNNVNLLGCDHEGADVLSKLIFGARVSIYIAVTTVFFTLLFGTVIGLFSGYYGGAVDVLLMRICDIFLAFPGILLAIAMAAMLGPSVNNVIIILTITGWVSFARLARGQVLTIKNKDYVLSAKAVNAANLRIIFIHILPNMLTPILIQATFSLAGVIVVESSLSFLGIGTPMDTPSWGKMLDDGRYNLFSAPRLTIFPGLAIMLIILSFNFIGDALRDYFDPKS